MDNLDNFRERFEALEQLTEQLKLRAHTVERRLRWWRGLACGLVMLGLVSLPLYGAKTQAQEGEGEEEGVEQQQLTLAQRVARLESKLRFLTRSGRNMFITGANLHIVNGLNSTDCTNEEGNEIPDCPNGLGNLIVGYNEPGGSDDIRTGSHNVVVGQEHNFSRFGGVIVGRANTISGDFAAVSGGEFNTASGQGAVVSGGGNNMASGLFSSVSGGGNDPALGQGNTASGFLASVSGGLSNTASGDAAAVSGGRNRTADGEFDWVAGGLFEDE